MLPISAPRPWCPDTRTLGAKLEELQGGEVGDPRWREVGDPSQDASSITYCSRRFSALAPSAPAVSTSSTIVPRALVLPRQGGEGMELGPGCGEERGGEEVVRHGEKLELRHLVDFEPSRGRRPGRVRRNLNGEARRG
jgi:hypothetical protein